MADSNYTADEIQSAVARLLPRRVSFPHDTLGTRRTDVTFGEIQAAAAGIFILYPNAPFYVLKLGFRRLNDQLVAEALLLDQLVVALQAAGRVVRPIDDVSSLFNAQAALQELGGAAALRSGTLTSITKAPAYQRFSSNVQSFLQGPGQVVRANGVITQTPQQAKASIPGLMNQLLAAHSKLVASVTSLANGILDYAALNLPVVAIQSILSNAQALLGSDAAAMNAQSASDRLLGVRQVVLNLLAVKSVVQTYGSFSGPSDFYALDGRGTAFSDALHPAVPAKAVSTSFDAFSIVQGVSDTLTLTVDGAGPTSITLNPSLIAQLDGTADDSTFVIGDGTRANGLLNNKFQIKVDGALYTATLAASPAPLSAAATGATDLSAAGLYGAGGTLDGTSLVLSINSSVLRTVTFVAPATSSAVVTQINAVTGTATNAVTASLTTAGGATILVLATNDTGAGSSLGLSGVAATTLGLPSRRQGSNSPRTADSVAADIQAVLPSGVQALGVYAPLRFQGSVEIPAGTNTTWTLTLAGSSDLVALGVLVGDTAQVQSGANAGPLFPITGVTSGSLTVSGTTVLQAGAVVYVGPKNRRIRLVCTNPATQVPAETTLTTVSTDAASAGGLSVLGFSNGGFSQCLRTPVDVLVADINQKTGVVTAGTQVVPVLTDAPAHTNPANAQLLTFTGATLSPKKYQVVSVGAGMNGGTYRVTGPGVLSTDVVLASSLPVLTSPISPTTNPLLLTASLFSRALTLSSKDLTTRSVVQVSGNAASLFFSTVPFTQRGSSAYLRLPSVPLGLLPGDLLEYYASNYGGLPSNQYIVAGVEKGLSLVQVQPDASGAYIPNDASWQFTPQPVPFARLRRGTNNDFTSVRNALLAWLALPVNQPTYLTNLSALVNPVLTTTTPTAVQVGTAVAAVNQLYSYVTSAKALELLGLSAPSLESILGTFVVQPVHPIDALIATYVSKGSDRAVDLLLQGRFSLFFGLSEEELSYAGALQVAARSVAQNDLPVRKTNRAESQNSRLIASAQSQDYEFTASSVTESIPGAQVDPPSDYGSPTNYGTKIG